MKKVSFIFLVSLFIFNCSSDSSPSLLPTTIQQPEFEVSTLGGSKNDAAYAVASTFDGGYVIAGYSQSADGDITDKDNESFDYWVLKFDEENNIQWSKTYGGNNDDRANSIIQTQDGGYAVLGYSTSNNNDVSENFGAQDYWLTKLDASGNITWQKSYGYVGADVGNKIIQTSDNGYFLIGVLDVTASGGEGNTLQKSFRHAGGDYWAIKTDSNGNIEWSKYYGGFFTDTPYDAIETNDNAFIIVGSSDSSDVDISNNVGTYDFWVVKISNTGEIIWEKSFGGTQIDEARAIIKTNDGNYIIAGDTRSNDVHVSQNNGAADLWLIKISPNGELLWDKSIGGSDFDVGRSISKTPDNHFIVSGSSRSINGDLSENQGQNDAWLLKIDNNANIIWQKTIGGSLIDYLYDAIQLPNNTVIAVGESSSNDGDFTENKGFSDLLIIKTK